MNQDELLVALCNTLLAETERQPGWSKLIMVGEMDGGSAGMAGYSFDLSGQWKATSPRGGESLDLLEQLHEAMTAASPTGRPWLACLLRIGSNGEVGADFEYDDAERWAINPRNLEQRIAEFAAMRILPHMVRYSARQSAAKTIYSPIPLTSQPVHDHRGTVRWHRRDGLQ